MSVTRVEDRPICGWCGGQVRGRWVTYILPDGSEKHSHGKARWFPEVYRRFGIEGLPYEVSAGPDGDILDFRGDSDE